MSGIVELCQCATGEAAGTLLRLPTEAPYDAIRLEARGLNVCWLRDVAPWLWHPYQLLTTTKSLLAITNQILHIILNIATNHPPFTINRMNHSVNHQGSDLATSGRRPPTARSFPWAFWPATVLPKATPSASFSVPGRCGTRLLADGHGCREFTREHHQKLWTSQPEVMTVSDYLVLTIITTYN